MSHFDASPSQLCFSLKVSLNGKCCLCMLQLCHAVTPVLAGRADWREEREEEEVSCGEEEGEVNNRQIVSALWLKDGCSKPLGVSSLARPSVRVGP